LWEAVSEGSSRRGVLGGLTSARVERREEGRRGDWDVSPNREGKKQHLHKMLEVVGRRRGKEKTYLVGDNEKVRKLPARGKVKRGPKMKSTWAPRAASKCRL